MFLPFSKKPISFGERLQLTPFTFGWLTTAARDELADQAKKAERNDRMFVNLVEDHSNLWQHVFLTEKRLVAANRKCEPLRQVLFVFGPRAHRAEIRCAQLEEQVATLCSELVQKDKMIGALRYAVRASL
jgi:hypothetical protein